MLRLNEIISNMLFPLSNPTCLPLKCLDLLFLVAKLL